MKSEVLKRAMFAQPLSKSARNSGIMAGFEEEEFEGEENEGTEEMPQMARTPQNPEILMNNLRGDIRSTDSRYQELAEMVGEEAAMQTPPEVLAMLQPMLAQQQGIAALAGGMPAGMPQGPAPGAAGAMPQGPGPEAAMPAPAMPAPEGGGIASLPMPPEMAPAQAPQGFAGGGIVQHFEEGSGPEGVTPAAIYPPELVAAAQQYARQAFTGAPRPVPELRATMEKRLPLYNDLLGMSRSKEDMQTQMLLDIASRGLAFAGNVDEQGRPLRGSFASRLGQATRTLPNTMMALLGEQRKGEMAAKQLALQASEKEIAQISELNEKDIESRRKLLQEVLKESAKAAGQSPFGKGDWAMAVVNTPNLMAQYAAGKTSEQQTNLIDSAYTKLSMPITEIQTRIDPSNQQPYTVTVQRPAVLPQFVTDAVAARARLMGGRAPTAAAPAGGTTAPAGGAAAPAGGAPGNIPSAAPPGTAPAVATTPGGPPPYVGAPPKTPPLLNVVPSDPTMWNLSNLGTGPQPITASVTQRIPILGNITQDLVDESGSIQGRALLDLGVGEIVRVLQQSPQYAEGERKAIQKEINLETGFFDRPQAYQQRLIAMDSKLLSLRKKNYRMGYENTSLGPEQIRRARAAVEDIDAVRSMMGVPPIITTTEQLRTFPKGHPVLIPRGDGTYEQRYAP